MESFYLLVDSRPFWKRLFGSGLSGTYNLTVCGGGAHPAPSLATGLYLPLALRRKQQLRPSVWPGRGRLTIDGRERGEAAMALLTVAASSGSGEENFQFGANSLVKRASVRPAGN